MTATPKIVLDCRTISPFSRQEDIDRDLLLAERARQGDLNAFTSLIEPYLEKLFKSIFKITKNHEDAEDLMQETLLRAFTRIEQFKGISRFSTWLISIGINEALMCLRARRKGKMISLDTSEQTDNNNSPSLDLWETRPNPEQLYRNTERAEMLNKVIDTLPSTLRTAFELRYVYEFSSNQTATILDISTAAVKARTLRARLHLKRRIAGRWEGDAWRGEICDEAI